MTASLHRAARILLFFTVRQPFSSQNSAIDEAITRAVIPPQARVTSGPEYQDRTRPSYEGGRSDATMEEGGRLLPTQLRRDGDDAAQDHLLGQAEGAGEVTFHH